MQTQSKFASLAVLVILGSLLVSLSTSATAQSDAVRAIYVSAANVPTNIPGIHTYAEPPKGFNPVRATEVELATYGLPARPDKRAEPDHYTQWERVVTAAKIRWNGELKLAPTQRHGMIPVGSSPRPDAVQSQVTGPRQISTINASGVILNNSQLKWNSKNSFNQVSSFITVPQVRLPLGTTCTQDDQAFGAFEYSLVGIDGFFFNPTTTSAAFTPGLLGGVLEEASCNPETYTAVYGYAGIAGYIEGTVEAFSVNPGDDFYVLVNAFDESGTIEGYVYLADQTNGTFQSIIVSSPGPADNPVELVGQSAEWLVLRGCCEGPAQPYGTWALANTFNFSFNGGTATNGTDKFFYPGSQASTTEILTMTDDAGDQDIELVNQGTTGYQGLHGLWFETTGCAYSGGCTP